MRMFSLFYKNDKGFLLLTCMFLLIIFWYCWSLSLDATDAKYAATTSKRALNRAVKAASMQVDQELLAQGIIAIDEEVSRSIFENLLRINLFLNADNTPSAASPIAETPEIINYYVYQGPDFPYTSTYYVADGINPVQHTFNDPGVLAIIKIRYKYNFIGSRMQDIYIYSAAEIKL